ncbi:mannose-1-phosphate guanylyltransferase [Dokdonia ponticola]|uniref:Mannose-1-phosphate guanylyltransferase n=1 Tax=Dokdonia ponticola TaxID=2041041 RepID=A0ABV9HR75_9FLAO
MKPTLKYIELKSGFGDSGPAWIGHVEFSKSGRTVYFNGKAFKNMNAMGVDGGNHYDIETRDEYWISGIKKNGTDRHWAGGGKIMIDRNVVGQYLEMVHFTTLDKNRFELVYVMPTDKQKFIAIENRKI